MPRDTSILPAARKGFLFGSWPVGHPVCFRGPLLALTIADCVFPAPETAVYVQEAYRVVPWGVNICDKAKHPRMGRERDLRLFWSYSQNQLELGRPWKAVSSLDVVCLWRGSITCRKVALFILGQWLGVRRNQLRAGAVKSPAATRRDVCKQALRCARAPSRGRARERVRCEPGVVRPARVLFLRWVECVMIKPFTFHSAFVAFCSKSQFSELH